MSIASVTSSSMAGQYGNTVKKLGAMISQMSSATIPGTSNPANLGISERLRSQISSTAVARLNIESATSALQTSQGWMGEVGDSLSRMRELAVQANNGTLSDTDRANIETEFKQIQGGIMATTSGPNAQARFNGIYLLRGGNGNAGEGGQIEPGPMQVQTGPDIGQTTEIGMPNMDVTNKENIGSYTTYDYDSSNQVTGSTTTQVTWNDVIDPVNGITASDPKALGALDKAIDFVATQQSANAAEQVRLGQDYDALLSSEANLGEAESKIRDLDMAQSSVQFAKLKILANSGLAMLTQAKQMPDSILKLLAS